jgi:hypothetical protein
MGAKVEFLKRFAEFRAPASRERAWRHHGKNGRAMRETGTTRIGSIDRTTVELSHRAAKRTPNGRCCRFGLEIRAPFGHRSVRFSVFGFQFRQWPPKYALH